MSYAIVRRSRLKSFDERITALQEEKRIAISFVERMKAGSKRNDVADDNNQIVQVLKELGIILEDVKEKERQRQWINEGLAGFVEILRHSNNDIKELSEKIIAKIIHYTGMVQGGIYLVNNDTPNDEHLQLIACYAYNRKKFIQKRIDLGEGILGQTYFEKEKVVLKEVPANYVQITSGLGEATPRYIIILPLLVNEDVTGILELASFKELHPYQVEFLDKLSENIAATFVNVKTAQRTLQLLKESELSQLRLKEHEEELKQTIEELQVTNENQARLQEELKHTQEMQIADALKAKEEIENVRKIESERSKKMLEGQQRKMLVFMEKTKEKEQELLNRIHELEEKLRTVKV